MERVLDLRGLVCPMPVIKTKKALNEIAEGEVLKVITTDPGSRTDIPALAKRTGFRLLDIKEGDREYEFLITR
ncbi:MAG TPA: sulfurtransferase TusA family protein [Nitrospirae bacterium]|nr:sulfurtransferase TusA family protein [Nitrospirota bacterium]